MRFYKEAKAKELSQNTRIFAEVREIIERVGKHGDIAVADYNVKFGGAPAASFRVPQSELERAYEEISPELRLSLIHIYKRVKASCRCGGPFPY